MKFLVIDDEFSCRAILRKFLSGHGQCDVAVDGLEMIEAFEISLKADAVYDVLFLDIMMPQMDGIEALSKIRELEDIYGIEEENQVRVVMTSALNDEKTKERCEKFCISGYITKPFSKDDIVQFISE
ncbi:response regulator [bacterium]|nr:response regulator [bacterium]